LPARTGAAVHEQEILDGVVGDEQVQAAVVIDVRGHHTQAFTQRFFDVSAPAGLGERAIAVVVKQKARGGLEDARDTVVLSPQLVVATGEMFGGAVIDKAAYEQV